MHTHSNSPRSRLALGLGVAVLALALLSACGDTRDGTGGSGAATPPAASATGTTPGKRGASVSTPENEAAGAPATAQPASGARERSTPEALTVADLLSAPGAFAGQAVTVIAVISDVLDGSTFWIADQPDETTSTAQDQGDGGLVLVLLANRVSGPGGIDGTGSSAIPTTADGSGAGNEEHAEGGDMEAMVDDTMRGRPIQLAGTVRIFTLEQLQAMNLGMDNEMLELLANRTVLVATEVQPGDKHGAPGGSATTTPSP